MGRKAVAPEVKAVRSMPETQTRVWLDEQGKVFVAPVARTCIGPDGRTHLLFAPFDRWILHPLTLCGLRAGEIPGAGDDAVDCFNCRQAAG